MNPIRLSEEVLMKQNLAKQRYECKDCGKRFDDLTGTIFSGHHQSLSKSGYQGLWFTSMNMQSIIG